MRTDLPPRTRAAPDDAPAAPTDTDKQLKEKLGGCSDMTVWHLQRDGKLPKPRKLGSRNVTPEEDANEAIAKLIGL